jgi:hypothetical protein
MLREMSIGGVLVSPLLPYFVATIAVFWLCRFVNGTIVEVRAYLDSALVARLFEENPI